MRLTSVDAGELGIDPDGLVQGAGEAALGGRALEAGETAARVHAAARGIRIAAHEIAVDRDEAEQVTLR
jgi:hypothetical protein